MSEHQTRHILVILGAASAIASIVAVVALAIAISAYGTRLDSIQRARQKAATDTCYILRALVLTATPAPKLDRATAYLAKNQLGDCNAYGLAIRDGTFHRH